MGAGYVLNVCGRGSYNVNSSHFLLLMLQDVIPQYPTTCPVEWLDAEDPLFLLYTSGSTGKPKVFVFCYCVMFHFSSFYDSMLPLSNI